MEQTQPKVKSQFLIERQGKTVVLYAGLLDVAHEEGLRRITTNLIQIPSEENGQVAIAWAEAETNRGKFSGIGDASPANVNRMILPAIIRMAETRAKARALRDAVNVGTVAFEELSDEDVDIGQGQVASVRTGEVRNVAPSPAPEMAPTSSGYNNRPIPGPGVATEAQVRAIRGIAKQKGWTEGKIVGVAKSRYNAMDVTYLSKQEASAFIDFLKTVKPDQAQDLDENPLF